VDAVLATHSETCAFAMRDVELFAGGDGGGCDLELISTPFSASTRFTFDHHQGDVNVLEGWLRNKKAENLAIWIASTESYAVVAEDEGRIVGLAMLSAEGTVSLCYLVPEAHHRNIGKAMLVALEEEACRRGLREVSVSSTRTAHSFYLCNEFVDEGSSESTLGLDSLRMRKAF